MIASGLPEPVIWTARVNLAIRAIARTAPAPTLPLPVTFEVLSSLVAALSTQPDHLLLSAAMCLQYFACLRSAEFCADLESGVVPLRSHVSFLKPGSQLVMVYRVITSKTESQGFTTHVGCSGHPSACAPCLMALYLSSEHRRPSAPLFVFSSGEVLTYRIYNNAIKSLVERVGLDPTRYSTHSFRAGAATQAAAVGMPAVDIKRLGRWKSDAYQSYLRPEPIHSAAYAPRLVP